ncbi:MAG TPA: NHL repeat-containing protein, partial [Pirellulaceae bacterium]|nr:NHL repeat-containing protein [Pirellulaceae bacterium]
MVTIPADGQYRLVFDGNGRTTGDFRFRLLDLDASPTLTLDTLVRARQPEPRSSTFYQFSGTAGQRLFVDSYDGLACPGNWALHGPRGDVISSSYVCGDAPVTLPTSGRYELRYTDVGDSTSTQDFHFRVVTATSSTQTLTMGDAYGSSFRFTTPVAGLNRPTSMTFGPNGDLFVADEYGGIYRFNGATGESLGMFAVNDHAGQVYTIWGITFGPDGNLYVAERDRSFVAKYSGTTGEYLGRFVEAGSGGLDQPRGLTFGPDGNLYVSSIGNNKVLRYDGTTGAFIDTFVAGGAGGLDRPHNPTFGPDGNLYVASYGSNQILKYSGATGATLGEFGNHLSSGLAGPAGLGFLANGDLLIGAWGQGRLLRLAASTGDYLGDVSYGTYYGGYPTTVLATSDGQVVVNDSERNLVLRLSPTPGGGCLAGQQVV